MTNPFRGIAGTSTLRRISQESAAAMKSAALNWRSDAIAGRGAATAARGNMRDDHHGSGI
jgi:hypothetical protein